MKKIVRASAAYNNDYIAERLLVKCKELRDMMDSYPDDALREFGFIPLYNELLDTIQEVSHELYGTDD